jgi:hypothetical protein
MYGVGLSWGGVQSSTGVGLSWGGGQSKNGTIHFSIFLLLLEQRQHASRENFIISVLALQTLNASISFTNDAIPLLCVEHSDGPMELSDGPIGRWRWAG